MQHSVKTPVYFWIIGTVSLLWNSVGAFDYFASQMKIEWYMSGFTQEQLDYYYAFPAWMIAAWAIGVWGAFFGSIALLLRKSWAVFLFGASLLGVVVITVQNFVLSNGIEVMGSGGAMFAAVIGVIAVALFFFARAMAKRGILA